MNVDAPSAAPPALPPTTNRPWDLFGVSRSTYYRLMDDGAAPRPLDLPGRRRSWRTADVLAALAAIPLRQTAAEGAADVQ